jgi:DHA2 family multidrug resistance protein
MTMTQILPKLLQTELSYTAMLAGLMLSPGGLVTMVMMPVTGRLIGSVRPKYLIAAGAAIAALSMWHLTGINGDISYGYAAMSRIYLAIGVPLLFLPITAGPVASPESGQRCICINWSIGIML